MITERFDTNNYEYNKKSPMGVYIIHGFSNTTYEVRALAKFLGENGFHTVAKNLPGHGTTIEECNRVKYTDWINHVTQDIAELASQSKKIYVIDNLSSQRFCSLFNLPKTQKKIFFIQKDLSVNNSFNNFVRNFRFFFHRNFFVTNFFIFIKNFNFIKI